WASALLEMVSAPVLPASTAASQLGIGVAVSPLALSSVGATRARTTLRKGGG
ncbi:MAG: hypothetical protein AVDCRST_MAG45-1340, partial [uncultured Solirubrobacterales bacterium]